MRRVHWSVSRRALYVGIQAIVEEKLVSCLENICCNQSDSSNALAKKDHICRVCIDWQLLNPHMKMYLNKIEKGIFGCNFSYEFVRIRLTSLMTGIERKNQVTRRRERLGSNLNRAFPAVCATRTALSLCVNTCACIPLLLLLSSFASSTAHQRALLCSRRILLRSYRRCRISLLKTLFFLAAPGYSRGCI